jgi:hypothetical protein
VRRLGWRGVSYGESVAQSHEDNREPAPAIYVETIRSRLRIGEMAPERYVALESHLWLLAGPLIFRYDDPKVDAHVRRVYELLMHGDLDELRRQWLSPEEFERVQSEIQVMNDPDYEP